MTTKEQINRTSKQIELQRKIAIKEFGKPYKYLEYRQQIACVRLAKAQIRAERQAA